MTITEFLLARIADDESVGRDWEHLARFGGNKVSIYGGGLGYERLINPARVQAECAAKRAVISLCEEYVVSDVEHEVLRTLAAVYADHTDYDPAWRA